MKRTMSNNSHHEIIIIISEFSLHWREQLKNQL